MRQPPRWKGEGCDATATELHVTRPHESLATHLLPLGMPHGCAYLLLLQQLRPGAALVIGHSMVLSSVRRGLGLPCGLLPCMTSLTLLRMRCSSKSGSAIPPSQQRPPGLNADDLAAHVAFGAGSAAHRAQHDSCGSFVGCPHPACPSLARAAAQLPLDKHEREGGGQQVEAGGEGLGERDPHTRHPHLTRVSGFGFWATYPKSFPVHTPSALSSHAGSTAQRSVAAAAGQLGLQRGPQQVLPRPCFSPDPGFSGRSEWIREAPRVHS